MSDGNEGRARVPEAYTLVRMWVSCCAEHGEGITLSTAQHFDLVERIASALSAARESALREAASMVDGVANTRQHVEDRIDAILREDARILAQRIRALLEPPPPPKGTSDG